MTREREGVQALDRLRRRLEQVPDTVLDREVAEIGLDRYVSVARDARLTTRDRLGQSIDDGGIFHRQWSGGRRGRRMVRLATRRSE